MGNETQEPFRQLVSEADIDWVVCIEMNSSPAFRDWLSEVVFADSEPLKHGGAWRSVANVTGESDLLWLVFRGDGRRLLALIENKINAVAQPQQFERYVERGQSYLTEGLCDQFVTILIAPSSYRLHDADQYERRIDYEAFRDWFTERGSERDRYLATIWERAIAKPIERAPADPEITEFRRRIWRIAARDFPELALRDPNEVSANQYWVEMGFGSFRIQYKMYKSAGSWGNCVVDLELPGRAAEVDALRQQYAEGLRQLNATVEQAGKSAAFRIQVPRVAPPRVDEIAFRAALTAASALLSWWRDRSEA